MRSVLAAALLACSPGMASAPSHGPVALRANAEIARDVLDLAFRLESGREVTLSRFEGPVRVRVAGDAPAALGPELDALLARLRDEAGLDVTRTEAAAEVVVEAVPASDIARAAPGAACFVAPGVASWDEFVARSGALAPAGAARERAAVFVPADAAPQVVRDCLHEEVAQALGPPGDLARLADSAFNDDNVQGRLTGFDMVALRAVHALPVGATRAEAAAALPAILARLNPEGERAGDGGRARKGLALVAQARAATDPEAALRAFEAAARAFEGAPEAALHRAHVALQLAAFALRRGDTDAVLALTAEAAPVAEAAGDAALLALLLALRAEAVGHAEEAAALRLDLGKAARYGFGDAAGARLAAVRSLSPHAPEEAS